MKRPSEELKRAAESSVRKAKAEAGAHPCLVGYDVNAIQEYITANSRPLAMRGGSVLISEFDARAKEVPGALFSGGGRGLFLVSEQRAQGLLETLPRQFAQGTVVGVLATAMVPWSDTHAQDSLQWLKLRLQNAKDAAMRPYDLRPAHADSRCSRCRMYEAQGDVPVDENETGPLCVRCHAITTAGRRHAKGVKEFGSLADLVPPEQGHIAVVSGDGNDMGTLFDCLDTLERLVAASQAVAEIFKSAHEAAVPRDASGIADAIAPITGGDDIRVFMAPKHVEPYLRQIVRGIEAGAEDWAPHLGLSREQQARFAKLGVGIGVVCASKTSPATSMLQRAHDLERSAKVRCRGGCRAAVDFRWVNTDDLYLAGSSNVRSRRDRRPIPLDESWKAFVDEVRALGTLPAGQRAVLAESDRMSEGEFANLFRYQVARSREWQDWYQQTGGNWRDSQELLTRRPDTSHVEFLRILGD